MTTPWLEYKGLPVRQVPGSGAYVYTTTHVEIDADGAPDAYHPDDIGLDFLANAGFPHGGWRSVLAVDPADPQVPFRQTSGPFAGYFVARTSLQDARSPETDVRRYVDATAIPYVVFPGAFHALAGTGTLGDFVAARHLASGLTAAAIVADIGPAEAALGEISIRLATDLGGVHPNPRTGAGAPRGPIRYVVFPQSHRQPKWPLSLDDIRSSAAALLAAAGGWTAIDRVAEHG